MRSQENGQPDVETAPRQRGRSRDWSFFFFFRILTRAEMAATQDRVAAASSSAEAWRILKLDLAQPGLATAGLVAQYVAERDAMAAAGAPPPADGSTPLDHPSQEFLNWLDVLANKRREGFLSGLADLTGLQHDDEFSAVAASTAQTVAEAAALLGAMREAPEAMFKASLRDVVAPTEALVKFLNTSPAAYLQFMQLLAAELDTAASAQAGPLPLAVLHEILRQGAAAFTQQGQPPDDDARSHDRPPVNLAFTYAGLAALKIDPATLASFPEVFKQGMAARARRLRDTGPSAPENWEGELGLETVHGYFSGGFDGPGPKSEAFWQALRSDVQAFNDKASKRGELLHLWIGLLFRFLGLEIVHIELGQEPYNVVAGQQQRLEHRTEHFGFRDGLSQPFANLRLEEPLPGGGTPTQDGWKPVAPGEIFLDQRDEDNETHRFPISAALRAGSTYLVFRKLEQDVHGFREFLARQRPSGKPAQALLAAQMIGRWPDGTPLINQPIATGAPPDEATINDFRYFAADKAGGRCPLGAHIRRVNPRDTGGRDEVRHHRLHRRGMSYGGALLPDGAADDGQKRGLLFIAANARIDVQFEVVQADWINGGEFLGQAGLGRCPMTGANNGTASDVFLEAGAPAPVTGLPRFVITRGGDYFFAPGVEALRAMIDPAEHFKVENPATEYAFSMGQSATPSLMSKDRLTQFVGRLLMGEPPIRAALPPQPDGSTQTVVFVGRHGDVSQVLSSVAETPGNVAFSTKPYHEAARRILGDQNTILSATDVAGPTSLARGRLKTVLDLGWETLSGALPEPIESILRREAKVGLEEALGAVLKETEGPAYGRRIDLVSDFAVQAAYGTIVRLYGVQGPAELPEPPPGPSFWREHQADVPRQWIAAVQGQRDPGLTAMQAWSVILTASLVSNFQNQSLLVQGAEYAAGRIQAQIAQQLEIARAKAITKPCNLIEAFVQNQARPEILALYPRDASEDQYYRDVSVLLLELVSTTLAAAPTAFGSLMTTILKFRIDLAALLPELQEGGLARLIYEAERLNPVLALRMRQCEADTSLTRAPDEPPAQLRKGDFVLAMVSAANLDHKRFKQPHRLSLAPFGPTDGPERRAQDYLMFGVHGDERQCWGRNRVAMPLLEECVLAASRLRGLRRVAGPDGELKTLANVAIGLTARFTEIAPPPHPAQA